MKHYILSILLITSLTNCWLMHDTVNLTIRNQSSMTKTVASHSMNIDSVILLSGETKNFHKEFVDEYCSVDFHYQNNNFIENYIWSPYVDSWPGEWSLIIEINDSGITFSGDAYREWSQLK